MTDRPFRFGIITEHLGFDTLLIRDHLAPDYFGPQFAPLPTLAFLAAVTTHLRLGTMVAANDFRHPTILAKEAATIDALSEGRFELGIGAGWLQREYEQIGLPYDRNRLRIDRLEESLEIIHRCFTENDISFAGKVYNLDRYQPFPAPVQPTGPPLLIGAGHPRMLRLAGKYADSVGLLTVSVSSGELRDDIEARRTKAVRERIAHVHDGAGDRAGDVELSLVPEILVTDHRATGLDMVITRNRWNGLERSAVEDMPAIFVGSVDEICETMRRRRDSLGLSYYVIPDRMIEQCAPIVATLSGS